MEVAETTCGSLLLELQRIWDEVGESEAERDKMLYEIEQACLEVYKRKVHVADECRRGLKKAIDVAESEIQNICSALREQPVKYEKKFGLCLKEELQYVTPLLEEMREKKAERKRQFVAVLDELQKVSEKIYGCTEDNLYKIVVEGTDLSMEMLEKLHRQLRELQEEKSKRLKHVLDKIESLNSLCGVLGMDFKHTIHTIHPTLNHSNEGKDITDLTIKRLSTAVESLREVKIQRMQRLQDLAATLVELWDLIDTPMEEQQGFQKVTSKIAASEPEITELNILSMDFIKSVEKEVSRLEQLKSSKVKEIVLKKTFELEEICRNSHMVSETTKKYSIEVLTAGFVDVMHLLKEIDLDIAKAKEEALSRKEILDKVDKWSAMCQEETWLEEYSRDENRYNAGRGTHLALKRAEKARVAVNKIPAMVELLTSKITAWERERGIEFLYDGEPLSSRLEIYNSLRQQREQERLKRRDQKRLQVQLIAEKEALFGSKPSPSMSAKKGSRTPSGVASNRKLSLAGPMLHNPKAEKASPYVHANKKENFLNQNSSLGYQHCGGVASQSSGRRISEIPGPFVNKHSSAAAKTHEKESHPIRKPLSPLSSTLSSKINIANFMEDQNRMQTGTLESVNPCIKTTPSKQISAGDEENRTPKTLPVPVPKTPSTISAPMLMSTTPATPYVTSEAKVVKKIMDEIEVSFEELRAGFVCPTLQS